MARYIMSITARDRSGIVAAVSEAGLELQGNIEAASQTVHQGYFAMMILWSLPGSVSEDQLIATVKQKAGDDLHVYVITYDPPATPDTSSQRGFIVTSIGPDKPGILRALTNYLGSKAINIDDLYACVQNDDFVVICQVTVPADQDVYMLQADLESVGQSLGVRVAMQHEDIFVATSELSLRRRALTK